MAQEPSENEPKVAASSDAPAQRPFRQDRPPRQDRGERSDFGGSSRGPRPFQPRSGPGDRGGDRGGPGDRGGNGPRRAGRFQARRKVCIYCVDKEKVIDWKKTDELRRFVNESGGIFPRRKSGLCAKHQRHVAIAVKRARHIALLPFTSEHVRVMG